MFVVTVLFAAKNQAEIVENSAWQEHREWFESQKILQEDAFPDYVNSLIEEASPYLLSHSLQPVNWQPWTKSTWDLAKSENKLVYLSIGYQTCHWCHVIAKESYQDLEVATILNNEFVSIKVDREVQVDVDNRYRRALENMSGEAGWPIQVILTPDEKILWIDSYLPKDDVLRILDRLSDRWGTNKELIDNIAQGLHQRLLPPLLSETSAEVPTSEEILDAYEQSLIQTRQILEVELSGSGPRFTRADWLLIFLEKYQQGSGNSQDVFLQLVEQQLEQLLTSPTYDIVEGGVHRYAVDGYWKVPHYEKMLYDQAMLIRVLAKLYMLTERQAYANIALQTVNWVNENLQLRSSGADSYLGYASSMSAISTSTGLEGDYYRISTDTINRDPFANWTWVNNEGGALIHARQPNTLIEQEQLKLYALREQSKKPDIDEKWILSWNALYLLSLNELYTATKDVAVYENIIELTESLLSAYGDGNNLQRIRFNNELSMPATLEDYGLAVLSLLASSHNGLNFEYQLAAEKIGETLISNLTEADWSNILQDGELPATAAFVYDALQQLLKISKTDNRLNAIKRIESNTLSVLSDNKPQYMAFSDRVASAHSITSTPSTNKYSASFASGKGIARLVREENVLWLELKLAPEWHINAPGDQSEENGLKITTVKSDHYPNLTADFPAPVIKTVSFFDMPLHLYEDLTRIQLQENGQKAKTATIKVSTQACSDRLCLLPEEFELLIPNL